MEEKKDDKIGAREKIEPIPYQHLAPVDDLDDKTTFDALDFALKNDKVHNIALTGSYGAGKSSILVSYIKWRSVKNPVIKFLSSNFRFLENFFTRHEQKNFLNISLATFALENNGELPDDKTQEIEKSILQQFFYKKPGNKFPYSRFNRIKSLSLLRVFAIELIIGIFTVFCLKYLKNDFWVKIRDSLKISFSFETKQFSFGISFFPFVLTVSVIISLFFIIKAFLKVINKIQLSKINLKEVEFGLGDIDNESLLNRYIDEVLYFFETTKYKFVIFEDLDRFENTEIFIKLRELNTIINNYEKIKQRVVFIYALRDEVFSDSSRTKFFEFIIPVIPVINSQNSNDIFLQKQKKSPNSALSKIDKHFLSDIGLYIDDMRLLTNTINEFRIYDEKINEQFYKLPSTEPHDRNKIFALILYKNLYPKDFASLSQNTGFLYNIFKSREKIYKKEIEELELENTNLLKEKEILEGYEGFSVPQLRRSYIEEILSTNNSYINTNSINEYLKEEKFNEMIKNQYILVQEYRNYSTGNKTISFNWESIQKNVNAKSSYKENEEYINSIINGKKELLISNIKKNKEKISSLKSCPIGKLSYLRSFIDEQEESEVNKDFIYYLLRNDFIDEDYYDYISYFYPESLSRNDKYFLLLIKNNKYPIYELKLDKVENIIKRIRSDEWTEDAVLNNDMLSYLLKNEKKDFIDNFVSVMYAHDSENEASSFYSQFTCKNEKLYEQLDFCLNKYLEADNYHYEKIFSSSNFDIFFRFFKNVEIDNKNYKLFIHNNIKFLYRDLTDYEFSIVEKRLVKLNQKFTLREEMKQYPIYELILKNKLYEVNLSNLLCILNLENGYIDDLISKLNDCEDYVRDYFYQNKNLFVEKVLLVNEERLHETDENTKNLITDDSISFELRKKIIEKNNSIVTDIYVFPKEINDISETNSINLWAILLSNSRVLPVWNNILVYYEEYGLDEYLIVFINHKIDEVSKSLLLTQEELDNRENERRKRFVNLFSDLFECDSLSNDVFEVVSAKCPFIYKHIDISALNELKVKALCENNKLSYTQDHINRIRDKNQDCLNIFINKNIKSALKEENKGFITENDIQYFLCSSETSINSLILFIESDNFSWETIFDEVVSKKVINYIVEKNHKNKIAVELSFMIKKMLEFDYKINKIIKLVNLQMDNYQIEEIKCSMELLKEPYKSLFIKERKQLEIIYSDFNEELCKKLKNKNLISSYSKDSKGNLKINRKLK